MASFIQHIQGGLMICQLRKTKKISTHREFSRERQPSVPNSHMKTLKRVLTKKLGDASAPKPRAHLPGAPPEAPPPAQAPHRPRSHHPASPASRAARTALSGCAPARACCCGPRFRPRAARSRARSHALGFASVVRRRCCRRRCSDACVFCAPGA